MLCCCPNGDDSDDNCSFQDKQTPSDNIKNQVLNVNTKEIHSKDIEPSVTQHTQEGSTHSERYPEGQLPLEEKLSSLQDSDLIPEEEIMSAEALSTAVNRLEAVASRLESLAAKSSGGSSRSSTSDSETLAPFVVAYDEFLNTHLTKFSDLSNTIGGDVKTMSDLVQKAFKLNRDFVLIASKSKKPADDLMAKLLKPLSDAISEVTSFRENNRQSKQINHLAALSEGIPMMGWVSVSPTPGPYVKEMQDAGMFYTNRVLKEYKEKDQKHVDWVKSWMAIFVALQAYIKEHHTTGLSWNPQGVVAAPTTAAKPSAGGSAPPPPPAPAPPPPPPVSAGPAAPAADEADRSALFEALNKGTDITKGLKKVTDDMKTHKNPTLRQGPAPFKAAAPAPKPVAKPAAAKVEAKPPVFELQNKKWVIEYQVGNKSMVLDDTNLKQVVYLYKCVDSAIQIKGKVNSIILDSCKKMGVAFDDVVSSIEFVNCQSVQGQVMGKVPTVSIDKTDGCLMYLSSDSLDVEIVSAKSSEMNFLVPKGDGDFTEFALPEQFKSVYSGNKFVTSATESV